MTTTYTWTTPRGAKVEATITTNHITTDTVYADGWNAEVDCDRWDRKVESMTVNGKPTPLKELHNEFGTDCILIDRPGKDRLLIALPADVVAEVYGEERETRKRRMVASLAASREYEAEYSRTSKAMAE